jgi:hypothetical protein
VRGENRECYGTDSIKLSHTAPSVRIYLVCHVKMRQKLKMYPYFLKPRNDSGINFVRVSGEKIHFGHVNVSCNIHTGVLRPELGLAHCRAPR